MASNGTPRQWQDRAKAQQPRRIVTSQKPVPPAPDYSLLDTITGDRPATRLDPDPLYVGEEDKPTVSDDLSALLLAFGVLAILLVWRSSRRTSSASSGSGGWDDPRRLGRRPRRPSPAHHPDRVPRHPRVHHELGVKTDDAFRTAFLADHERRAQTCELLGGHRGGDVTGYYRVKGETRPLYLCGDCGIEFDAMFTRPDHILDCAGDCGFPDRDCDGTSSYHRLVSGTATAPDGSRR